MADKKNILTLYIDDTGGTYEVDNDPLIRTQVILIKRATGDTGTLSGSVTITADANVENGVYYKFQFEDTFVLGANTFSVFGENISAAQLLAHPQVTVNDNGTSYDVYLEPNALYVTTETANIANKAVTLAKLEDLTRGFIIRGNSESRPVAYDAKTSGRILVGDGTDLVSVAVSGDATLASSGALTVADDAITNAKLANITRGSIKVGGTSNAPTDLDAKTNGYILIGDGTDLNSVVTSGDATISNTGAITIAVDAVTNTKLANIAQGSVKVGGAANAPTDLDNSADGALIIGDGTGVSSQTLSGDVSMDGTGAVTIVSDAITTSKILDDNVTVDKVSDNLKYETFYIPVSFESGEVGVTNIKVSFAGTVVEMYAFATKAIAATDSGTIVLKNNAGLTMTNGTITYTASDARGTVYTVLPSANNIFSASDVLTVTTAKATVGGKVLLAIKVLKA